MTPDGMHALEIDDFLSLDPGELRRILADWLATFVAGGGSHQDAARDAVASLVDSVEESEVAKTLATFRDAGSHYGFFGADPVARAIIRVYLRSFCAGSTIDGITQLKAAADAGPVLLLCNHLAYCDTVPFRVPVFSMMRSSKS